MSNWFTKLFNEGKADIEVALDHVEAEFTSLENSVDARFIKLAGRISALEGHPAVSIPILAYEPPANPTAPSVEASPIPEPTTSSSAEPVNAITAEPTI